MFSDYICALDIGSSKIAGAVIQMRRKYPVNIFLESISSKGIKRGVVIDALNLTESISRVLKKLKAKSGANIKYIYTNISGQDIVTKHSRAVIPLAERGNKVITFSDIEKVNAQARILAADLQEEIIHQMPFSYSTDSSSNILNPLGLYSHRLEVDLYLLCANLSSLQNLSRAVNQAGYEIKDLFFSGLATSRVVLPKELQQGLTIFCDLGSDITELLIFKDGRLCEIKVLGLGGNDLTCGLSEALKIPFELAEEIKHSSVAVGDDQQTSDDKEILVKKSNSYKPIKQKEVCQILSAKTKSISEAIKVALDKRRDPLQINNFIATGRTVLLGGFLEILENILGFPVKLGRINEPQLISLAHKENALSGQKYLNYITCLGIISQARKEEDAAPKTIHQLIQNPLLKAINKFKEVYQEYF